MVAIAIDRYFCICRPWPNIIDIRIAKRIITSIRLLSFAISLGLITSLAYSVYHYLDYDIPFWELYPNLNYTSASNATITTFSAPDMLRDMIISGSYDGTEMTEETQTVKVTRLILTVFCCPNKVIFDKKVRKVRKVYQKFYVLLFVIAFISVFILYALTYKSMLTWRSKRVHSSVPYRHLNGRVSTLLTSTVTKQSNCHEKSFIATESQNNAKAEKIPLILRHTIPNRQS